MATWKKLCAEGDIAEGKTKLFNVNGKLILVGRDQGELHAIAGYCTHDGGELDGEEVIDGQVECSRHGAMFDLRSGDATMMPAVYGVATYDLKIEDDHIHVDMG
jgi:3-phenylpropionate/trans-cinnamate dioxygenase ferredoxin subunit